MPQNRLPNRLVESWRRWLHPPRAEVREAARRAEVSLTRIRLLFVTGFTIFAALTRIASPEDPEARVSLILGVIAFALATAAASVVQQGRWHASFALLFPCVEMSLVTAGLFAVMWIDSPQAGTNNLTLFGLYFLVIFGTCLRYDARASALCGLMACAQYAAVWFAATHFWDLADPSHAFSRYGRYDFGSQAFRLLLLAGSAHLAVVCVVRAHHQTTLSARDDLTGLLNRRFCDEAIRSRCDDGCMQESGFTVALLDLDRFKAINDRYGHAVGDQVLRFVASILRRSFRTVDLVSRYGGEEFCVLLEDADPAAAIQRVDRVRRELGSLSIPVMAGASGASVTVPPVQMSVGVAAFPDDATRATKLLATADGRLYQAKRSGGNAVVGPSPGEEGATRVGPLVSRQRRADA